MNAFEEEIQDDGVILFYVFLREHIGFTNEAIMPPKLNLPRRNLL
jgi:hypothetical protein